MQHPSGRDNENVLVGYKCGTNTIIIGGIHKYLTCQNGACAGHHACLVLKKSAHLDQNILMI